MQDPGMQQRVDDRPPSVGKRHREWEEESAAKKQANEENRARLDDRMHRRPSTPPREPYRRNSDEARRYEEQRRADEQRREDMQRADEQQRMNSYHPSEAAHHPQSHMPPSHLPPMQQGPAPMQMHDAPHPQNGPPAPKEYPQGDRPNPAEHHEAAAAAAAAAAARPAAPTEPERAARKVEVDENYDEESEDKKVVASQANGAPTAPGSSEMKTTTPTSATMNGVLKKEP
jgi:general transcriptional corepressor CYC8